MDWFKINLIVGLVILSIFVLIGQPLIVSFEITSVIMLLAWLWYQAIKIK